MNDALNTLLPIAGWSSERGSQVDMTGGADPILPTPFPIGETSVASLAAIGLAVSDLWEFRTGRPQEVAVDARQATASLHGAKYMRLNGEPNARKAVYSRCKGAKYETVLDSMHVSHSYNISDSNCVHYCYSNSLSNNSDANPTTCGNAYPDTDSSTADPTGCTDANAHTNIEADANAYAQADRHADDGVSHPDAGRKSR